MCRARSCGIPVPDLSRTCRRAAFRRGAWLATTGGEGKTVACGICHGTDLKGVGPVPALAGRSPSYLFRQLYDIKHGTRYGAWTSLMQPVVVSLNEEEMVALAGYAASRAP